MTERPRVYWLPALRGWWLVEEPDGRLYAVPMRLPDGRPIRQPWGWLRFAAEWPTAGLRPEVPAVARWALWRIGYPGATRPPDADRRALLVAVDDAMGEIHELDRVGGRR